MYNPLDCKYRQHNVILYLTSDKATFDTKRKKNILLAMTRLCISYFVCLIMHCWALNPSQEALAQAILHETEQITQCEDTCNAVDACYWHLARAESYILIGEMQQAKYDLEKSLNLFEQLNLVDNHALFRVLFGRAVDELEDKALECCATGEFWKECVQPLVNKLSHWNKGYFPELPDPMWD